MSEVESMRWLQGYQVVIPEDSATISDIEEAAKAHIRTLTERTAKAWMRTFNKVKAITALAKDVTLDSGRSCESR